MGDSIWSVKFDRIAALVALQ